MGSSAAVLVLCAFLACWVGSSNGQAQFLRETETITDIPRPASGGPVNVTVRFTLQDIVNVDPENNIVELVMWTSYRWQADSLRWNPMIFNNTSAIRMPVEDLWKPDVVPYASARPSELLSPPLAIVESDGAVTYVPAQRFTIMSDVTYYDTRSGTHCSFKFGSWVYHGLDMDLLVPEELVDMYEYFPGSKFEVMNATQTRQEIRYTCCPEPFVEVKIDIMFREKREESFFSSLIN